MKKFNKIISGALAALMIFTSVPIYATNDFSTEITSEELSTEITSSEIETTEETSTSETSEKTTEEISTSETSEETTEIQDKPTVFVESDEDPEETDNWELSTVFYDSTVENGTKPLTEINWDASDGGYGEGTPRVITVQINYKNTNTVTTYQPGELSISIEGLLNGADVSWAYYHGFHQEVTVGANDSSHSGYDWDYEIFEDPENEDNSYGSFIFTNTKIIEEKANFEGSIQIAYTITPVHHDGQSATSSSAAFSDTHTYSFSKTLKANINEFIESNEIYFNYTREYIHPWERINSTIEKSASKLTSLDGLPSGEFYWVKYVFGIERYSSVYYPYYGAYDHYIIDSFPSECIVLDQNLNQLNSDNNSYRVDIDGTNTVLYVGYPKSIYNDKNNNLNITNHVDLYAKYRDTQEYELTDYDEVSLNLADFEFSYSGSLYGIYKNFRALNGTIYYQSLSGIDTNLGGKGITSSIISPKAIFTGKPMDVKFGDDLLYITDTNNNYRKLNDNEYYFSKIIFPVIKNGNGQYFQSGKYDCELWVRYSGDENYSLYESFKNSGRKTYNFDSSDKIVGYYFIIKQITESIVTESYSSYSYDYSQITINNASNIAKTGRIYNFTFLQVYIDGILQNEATLDNYANFITKDTIAQYDIQAYGEYVQRDCSSLSYSKYKIPEPKYELNVSKSVGSFKQDAENEIFTNTSSISFKMAPNDSEGNPTLYEIQNYYNELGTDFLLQGFEAYDLLPEGMILTSSKEDIIKSLSSGYINERYYFICDQTGQKISTSSFTQLIQENASITIINNYKNTNRTYLSLIIDLSDSPIYAINFTEYSYVDLFTFTYDASVSYDAFLEHGNVWENRVYYDYHNKDISDNFNIPYNKIQDNGTNDIDEIDINNNNNTTEIIGWAKDSETITSVVSTHQDVQTQTASSLSNYSTGTVPAEYDKDYSYKLRIRSGKNDVTNLVIYDNLEKWAKDQNGNFVEAAGKKKYWQGEFLGIDTSYAESKGYNVKVWYSENEKAGTLAEDPSWQEYSDSVDKTKVKSLAFQYLDAEGNPAVLPANSLTYVVVNMKAPADENIKTFAYNGCWTQWNAIDEFGQPVDFITGINSNIVKVALPNSVLENEIPSIQLNIEKEIQGTQEAFKNMQLDPNGEYQFMISLIKQEENEDGSHDIINGVISNKKGIVINDLSYGTWLITESDDTYFDLVEIISLDDPEIMTPGVTFEKTDAGYILTIDENIDSATEYSLKVINEIEPERFYEDKDSEINLFNGAPIIEEQSILNKLINFFK